MHLSVATANLFYRPFEKVLDIIAEAGFQNIELDLFWERKEWAMAQHLRDVPIKQVVRLVERSGLKITSIHDGGGVLEDENSTLGFINPALDQYLNAMGYAPDCLIFHTPHIEGEQDIHWWQHISDQISVQLEKYRKGCTHVTIENMPMFPGYFVPLTSPEELNTFALENGLGVTLDTTHYAEIGVDICDAARIIGGNLRTIHLSDFTQGRRHVFIGEGEMDFAGFFEVVDREQLNAVTLECSLSSITTPGPDMDYKEMVNRMREARFRLDRLLA